MYNPVSTYRLQFHKDFTFEDFERIIPYLQKLGISTVYASPIFQSTPGSTHGYDSLNPHRVNPEIGTEEQLKELHGQLTEKGMGWLQDIVPNHMAFDPGNPWLMDVMEKGPFSVFTPFFDVAWTSQLFHGRLMVPFLGDPLEEVIKKGELKVAFNGDRLMLQYYDSAYPLHLRSYTTVLETGEPPRSEAIIQLLNQLDDTHQIEEAVSYGLRWEEVRKQFAVLMDSEDGAAYLQRCLDAVNNNPALIQQISDEQVYRLCHWQETDKVINFRRFFTVNGLICLNIQDPQVFQYFHQYIKSLVDLGIFQGLRVDHIDGLYNPSLYLEQLRELAGEDTYVVVEKILELGEKLPQDWPIQGTTGYDYLAVVNNVFTQKGSEKAFTRFYEELTGDQPAIHQQIRDKKAHILFHHMGGELNNLYNLFLEQNLVDEATLNALPPDTLKTAIAELLIQCPVYRYYGDNMPLDGTDADALEDLFQRIRQSKAELAPAIDLLQDVLLKKPLDNDEEYNQRALRFYQRSMQFTGPLMAKGVEDTLMYTYNRFAGHNEVGDSPESFGLSPDAFHESMQERQELWPLAINGSSTHDTKRGEDVRARLNVLTNLPDEWLQAVREWQKLNADLKADGAPDANDEYFIYQTLVGAYPMPGEPEDNFSDRLPEYLQKAMREAKQHSFWDTPNEEYETAMKTFAAKLLDAKRPFWKSFEQFHRKIADFGIVNSLAQVVLKMTTPGLPDVYQGSELWDLSLVDPDNRRPIDYEQRQQALDAILTSEQEPADLIQELWQDRYTARIKLWLVHHLLSERKQQADVFTEGRYIPLAVEGKYKDNVLAFARHYQQMWYVVAIPLHLASLSKQQKKEVLLIDWADTRLVVPAEAPEEWTQVLQGTTLKGGKELAVSDLFTGLPVAVLRGQHPINDRRAGVLMAITSLPSAFGIGDIGPTAREFADFLSRSRQSYWQLLPLNPTEADQGYSPYSSISSTAGNPLLISPEELASEGLLDADELAQYHLPAGDKVDYAAVGRHRQTLFDKAYAAFREGQSVDLPRQFRLFCEREAEWLDDFALYVVLKQEFGGEPWHTWPEEYKIREPQALADFIGEHTDALDKAKWLQFIFARQWKDLKTYCNNLGVQLFGDLPFYISYDSADVWANPAIFSVDEEGKMTGVAGVPPDYFNDEGQLWGMPVFRWDVLKERGYDWWIRRIRKNMELYDLLRLDHFRAFADYWEVPASEKTAINGEWKIGPGADLFQIFQQELGSLPFVAEDLGDISPAVYALRDEFMLPGMKVLQFAFSESMPRSVHIPHNYTPIGIAYTGTHDNNTTRGWYRQEVSKEIRKQIEQYIGRPVTEANIHQALGQLAYASVAQTVILPIQDVLGLDETARMNTPASTADNWQWRLRPHQLTAPIETQLRSWVKLYNRG